MAKTKTQRSLDRWTEQDWTTPSGKPSKETGEVYQPKAEIERRQKTELGRQSLARANRKKREATAKGQQHADHGLNKGRRNA
ncbi:MAG: hypothetical protein NWE76_06660 [Candidatus Bathyarchaeota archaeon]|nr:hypothetical protein [Candidatus Bathyarchaeota archaeon]